MRDKCAHPFYVWLTNSYASSEPGSVVLAFLLNHSSTLRHIISHLDNNKILSGIWKEKIGTFHETKTYFLNWQPFAPVVGGLVQDGNNSRSFLPSQVIKIPQQKTVSLQTVHILRRLPADFGTALPASSVKEENQCSTAVAAGGVPQLQSSTDIIGSNRAVLGSSRAVLEAVFR